MLLADERSASPVLLSQVASIIWTSLDGNTSLAELIDDLTVALGGSADHHRPPLYELLRSWALQGFIDGIEPPSSPEPRRTYRPISADSCAGKRIGLGHATVVQVELDGEPAFRLGSTDPDLVHAIVAMLPARAAAGPTDELWLRTVVLRSTKGRGRRLQQLFDTRGELLWTGRDIARAEETFARTISAFISQRTEPRSVWINGPVLELEGRSVVIHPTLSQLVLNDLRSELEEIGWFAAPSALFGLDVSDRCAPKLVLPPASSAEQPRRLDLSAVLIAEADLPPPELVLHLTHLAASWDPAHLEAVAVLAHPGGVATVPVGLDPDDVVTALGRLAANIGSAGTGHQ